MSYAAVLRAPRAARTFGSALVGRLSYGTVSLSLLLSVASATGSYALAGTVMALFAATSAVLSPLRAGFIDRRGPRRALPPMSAAYALTLAALAAATWRPGVPAAVIVLLTIAAGAFAPPLGPTMRALWSELVPDPDLRQRAFSLDTVCEELLYVTGPLIAGLLATRARPAVGVALSAVLVLVGSVLLARACRPRVPAERQNGSERETAEQADADQADADQAGAGPAAVNALRGGLLTWMSRMSRMTRLVRLVRLVRRRPVAPRSGLVGRLLQPLAVAAGTGACLGAFGLLVVVFAQTHGQAAAAAWVEAALAAGSAVGGLVFGAISWRASARVRLAVLAATLAGSIATAAAAPGVAWLALAGALTGLTVSPTLTTAYLLADELADPDQRTTAGSLVNTAFNAGSSIGTAGIGLVTGALPVPLCFLLAAAPAALAALSAPRRPATAPAAPTVEVVTTAVVALPTVEDGPVEDRPVEAVPAGAK